LVFKYPVKLELKDIQYIIIEGCGTSLFVVWKLEDINVVLVIIK